MSSVKDRLKSDLKIAMKEKDSFKRDTIRFLMSAIKQVEVDNRVELSDDEIYKIIQKSLKQRDDAAKQYKEAGRDDLFDKESKEASILREYLPKQLTEEELNVIIKQVIEDCGAKSLKDMGKVIKESMQKVGSSADGRAVSTIVKNLLS